MSWMGREYACIIPNILLAMKKIDPLSWERLIHQWEDKVFKLAIKTSNRFSWLVDKKLEIQQAIQIELSNTETELETRWYDTVDWLFSDACQIRTIIIPILTKDGIAIRYPTIRKKLIEQYYDSKKRKDLIGKWGRYYHSREAVIRKHNPQILSKFDGYILLAGYHPKSESFFFQFKTSNNGSESN